MSLANTRFGSGGNACPFSRLCRSKVSTVVPPTRMSELSSSIRRYSKSPRQTTTLSYTDHEAVTSPEATINDSSTWLNWVTGALLRNTLSALVAATEKPLDPTIRCFVGRFQFRAKKSSTK